jgi:hypothetical protein
VNAHISGTAAVLDAGLVKYGQDADAVPAAPPPVLTHLSSLAPEDPPKANAVDVQVGDASVFVLYFTLIVVKSLIFFLLLTVLHY